jgi:hypothetical protein
MLEAPKTEAAGEAVSRPGFKTDGWLDATVPGTVLSTYVDRGVYPDPDFGLNNLLIPETLNKQDYWFRTEFRVACTALREGGRVVGVELVNRGASAALNVSATLRDAATGARVLPAYASDNYVSLLPGERRRLTIEAPAAAPGRALKVEVKGWNVPAVSYNVR